MFKFDAFQSYGKESFDAAVASVTALSQGYQTVAQEVIDFNRRSFEKGSYAFEQASQLKSVEQVAQANQTYAKEAVESFVSESSRIGNLYMNAMKEAYRPFEATMQNYGMTNFAAKPTAK
jgi:hypothetical protein